MTQILVVAAKGRRVRNPGNPKARPIAGAVSVDPNNPFWARRLVFGDVVETTPEKVAAEKALTAAKAKEAAAEKNVAVAEGAVADAAPAQE